MRAIAGWNRKLWLNSKSRDDIHLSPRSVIFLDHTITYHILANSQDTFSVPHIGHYIEYIYVPDEYTVHDTQCLGNYNVSCLMTWLNDRVDGYLFGRIFLSYMIKRFAHFKRALLVDGERTAWIHAIVRTNWKRAIVSMVVVYLGVIWPIEAVIWVRFQPYAHFTNID